MNAHHFLESFLSLSFRVKAGLILVLLAAAAAAEFAVYRAGVNAGDERAAFRGTIKEKKFQIENAALAAQTAVHKESEKRFAAENELLKNQQTLQAQISAERDNRIRAEAQNKLNSIFQEKEKKLNEIDNLDGFDANLCALCADYTRHTDGAGSDRKLSAAFCGKCAAQK